MSWLLDTHVVSEWVRPRPDPGVIRFLEALDEDRVFVSVATLAELRLGIGQLDAGPRRSALERWLSGDLVERFSGRVLGVDAPLAEVWGLCLARSRTRGRPISVMDALLAATARLHGLTLVTRNVSDFRSMEIGLHNPWTA
ncbi:MAG: type II toxin-antitoxin system VapC family toxin [Steroidobacteraceae bacterium]